MPGNRLLQTQPPHRCPHSRGSSAGGCRPHFSSVPHCSSSATTSRAWQGIITALLASLPPGGLPHMCGAVLLCRATAHTDTGRADPQVSSAGKSGGTAPSRSKQWGSYPFSAPSLPPRWIPLKPGSGQGALCHRSSSRYSIVWCPTPSLKGPSRSHVPYPIPRGHIPPWMPHPVSPRACLVPTVAHLIPSCPILSPHAPISFCVPNPRGCRPGAVGSLQGGLGAPFAPQWFQRLRDTQDALERAYLEAREEQSLGDTGNFDPER